MQRYQITHIGNTPRFKPLTFGEGGEMWAAYTGGSEPLSNALITRENFGGHRFTKQKLGCFYSLWKALSGI
ncbi:hypothetical protein [Agrobacterium salinitolerans]|uniref:hypothetical protein n=1 Tax=Agrobacterium salinitolerans TaxID=1183413 RepID=UPI0017493BE1